MALTCVSGFLLFLYINLFPALTVRKTSTRRNKILADGIALLQLFLATTLAELLFVPLYFLFLWPESSGATARGAGFVISVLLLILAEAVLFWNGIIRVYATSACTLRNEKLPDSPDVYYQSVGSQMNCASSGRFPLNMAYPLVRHFDGANDGLVSMESARWGENFTGLTTAEGRGISHGDMIDLNRENVPGFDVREFYVNLVADLKKRGY